ncbi:hypothetical protein Tco_0078023 [Tanacetum coccineum]
MCYPLNDRDDHEKLNPKGDLGVFIIDSSQLSSYCIYNRRTRNIMETMHARFDDIPEMASDQLSSEPILHKAFDPLRIELMPNPKTFEQIRSWLVPIRGLSTPTEDIPSKDDLAIFLKNYLMI